MAPRTNLAVAHADTDIAEENHRTAARTLEPEMGWEEFHEKFKYLKRRVGSNEATQVRITDENGNPVRAVVIGSY
jgi:hypothetical protein